MQLTYFIGFILYFIACQYVVEKEKLPRKLMEISVMKLLFLGIGSIIASIIIGNVLQIGVFLVTAVSVFAASVIAGKYRKVFNKMEEGNKV